MTTETKPITYCNQRTTVPCSLQQLTDKVPPFLVSPYQFGHDFIMDLIDIDPDRSQMIYYCQYCYAIPTDAEIRKIECNTCTNIKDKQYIDDSSKTHVKSK